MSRPLFVRVPSAREKERRWTDPPSVPWHQLREIRIEVRFRVTVPGGEGLGLTLNEWLGLVLDPADLRVPESMTAEAAQALADRIHDDVDRAWMNSEYSFLSSTSDSRRRKKGKKGRPGSTGTIYLERLPVRRRAKPGPANLSDEQRHENAATAARARWAKTNRRSD